MEIRFPSPSATGKIVPSPIASLLREPGAKIRYPHKSSGFSSETKATSSRHEAGSLGNWCGSHRANTCANVSSSVLCSSWYRDTGFIGLLILHSASCSSPMLGAKSSCVNRAMKSFAGHSKSGSFILNGFTIFSQIGPMTVFTKSPKKSRSPFVSSSNLLR